MPQALRAQLSMVAPSLADVICWRCRCPWCCKLRRQSVARGPVAVDISRTCLFPSLAWQEHQLFNCECLPIGVAGHCMSASYIRIGKVSMVDRWNGIDMESVNVFTKARAAIV